jgi:hypothetical protein
MSECGILTAPANLPAKLQTRFAYNQMPQRYCRYKQMFGNSTILCEVLSPVLIAVLRCLLNYRPHALEDQTASS